VTSGTVPLRRLKNTVQFVSIDGASAETHDEVRGSKGLYERIKKNLQEARRDGVRPIFIHTVLNHLNFREVGDILEVWSENGLAQAVAASTMTPITGAGDDDLRLSRDERIWIVGELQKLKATHGDFLIMTPAMIDRLHPDYISGLHPGVCFTAAAPSYDAAGEEMKQCILSEKAVCSECGCIITTIQDSYSRNATVTLLESLRFLIGVIRISQSVMCTKQIGHLSPEEFARVKDLVG
jgi:hypothetical protein